MNGVQPSVSPSKWTTGLRSSERGNWKTPKALYDRLVVKAGRFDVSDTHGGKFNALRDPWPDDWFANPPYGREIAIWCAEFAQHAKVQHLRGVALLLARTDTFWFHEFVLPLARLTFLRGRLHFDEGGPAPFPSMLAWYGEERP